LYLTVFFNISRCMMLEWEFNYTKILFCTSEMPIILLIKWGGVSALYCSGVTYHLCCLTFLWPFKYRAWAVKENGMQA
jgi:hypothetical protein